MARGVELATAYVPILPSMRGAKGHIERELSPVVGVAGRVGSQSGQAFTSAMGGKVRSGAKAMFLPIAAGTAVLGGVAAAGLKMGLSVAAGNEQATIAFTTMLGSAKEAGSFITDLQKFAAKTPFEFEGLQQSASSLISAGINADKVIPIMTTLGNVTSGMGTGAEGVQRATIALQQMSAAGRITGEDLNQLRDAGIPVYDLLAKATGKSKEEVVKLAQAGKLGKKELGQMMTALESGAGLERFAGLMKDQSGSLKGIWSTVLDVVGQGTAKVITPLIPMIKQGLSGAISVIERQVPKLTSAMTVGVGALKAFRGAYKNPEDGTTSSGFALGMEKAAIGLRRLQDGLSTALGPFKAFTAAFKAGDGDVTSSGFAGVMERIGSTARTAFDYLKANGPSAIGSIKKAIAAVKPGVVYAVQETFEALRKTAKTLKPYLDKMWADFGPAVESLLPTLVTLASAFNPVSLVVHGLLPVLPTLADAVGKVAVAFSDALLPILPPLAKVMALLIGEGFGALSGVLTKVVPPLASFVSVMAPLAPFILGAVLAFKAYRGAVMLTVVASQAAALATYGQSTALAGHTTLQKIAVLWGQRQLLATKALAAGQLALNFVLSANPIGLIVLGIAALVAGFILAYKNSETFRNIVDGAFRVVKASIGAVVDFVVTKVPPLLGTLSAPFVKAKDLIDTALTDIKQIAQTAFQGVGLAVETVRTVVRSVVEWVVLKFVDMGTLVLRAADTAFGWIPKVGDGVRNAAKSFESFKERVNGALAATDNSYTLTANVVGAQNVIDSLVDIKNLVNYIKNNGQVDIGVSGRGVAGREHGGPVTAGVPYIVGERRPELFVPNQNGRIVPRVPAAAGAPNVYVQNPFTGEYLLARSADQADRAAASALGALSDSYTY